jgi:hypothetical protein
MRLQYSWFSMLLLSLGNCKRTEGEGSDVAEKKTERYFCKKNHGLFLKNLNTETIFYILLAFSMKRRCLKSALVEVLDIPWGNPLISLMISRKKL